MEVSSLRFRFANSTLYVSRELVNAELFWLIDNSFGEKAALSVENIIPRHLSKGFF
jgi:hypothetical protein